MAAAVRLDCGQAAEPGKCLSVMAVIPDDISMFVFAFTVGVETTTGRSCVQRGADFELLGGFLLHGNSLHWVGGLNDREQG